MGRDWRPLRPLLSRTGTARTHPFPVSKRGAAGDSGPAWPVRLGNRGIVSAPGTARMRRGAKREPLSALGQKCVQHRFFP